MRELRELAEKATPGPWSALNHNEGMLRTIATTGLVFGPDGDQLAYVRWCAGLDNDPFDDAAYIAAASPDVVLALLDVVEAARTLCDDEESGAEGFGPDITHITPLRAALDRLDSKEVPA